MSGASRVRRGKPDIVRLIPRGWVLPRDFTLGSAAISVENGKGSLASDRASSRVGIRDHEAERALTQAQPDQLRGSEPSRGFYRFLRPRLGYAVGDSRPALLKLCQDSPTLADGKVVPLAAHDVFRKVIRRFDPVLLIKEKRLSEDNATNVRIRASDVRASIVPDAGAHLLERPGAVLHLEGGPRQGCRHEVGMREKTAAHYDVPWPVELEEEESAAWQCTEGPCTARLPEVDLIYVRLDSEKLKPVPIRDADVPRDQRGLVGTLAIAKVCPKFRRLSQPLDQHGRKTGATIDEGFENSSPEGRSSR